MNRISLLLLAAETASASNLEEFLTLGAGEPLVLMAPVRAAAPAPVEPWATCLA